MDYPPNDNGQPQFEPPPPPNTYYPAEQQYNQQWQPPPPMYPPVVIMQPPQKKSSRLWLWIVLGVIGFLLFSCIGFFILLGAAVKSTTTGTINTVSTTTTSSSNTPSSSQIAKVGQTITVDDVATTLVSVKILTADEFTQPKHGNEFIVVHVKIVNNSTAEQDYNVFNFHVRSGSGNITDEEFVAPQSYTVNNQLNSGKLSPDGSVEGDIIFQVPKNDHKAQLTWQPNYFGNAGDNAWNLGL
jgi:Domain of unknown function (DUF4352)